MPAEGKILHQSFHFLCESAVRLEFHLTADGQAITLESLFNPPRDPDRIVAATADEVADEIEKRVKLHLEEWGESLSRIRWRLDLEPLTILHLARYAVPILPIE